MAAANHSLPAAWGGGRMVDELGALDITMLGRVGLSRDGSEVELQPAQRHLLALLVVIGPDGATTEWLADELWADELPTHWRASIRVAVSRLRKRSGRAIPSINGRYHLDASDDEVDLWRLKRLADEPDRPLDRRSLHLITAAEVFPSVELSPALQTASVEITSLQRMVAERIARTGGRLEPAELVGVARLLRRNPYDADMTAVVATIYANNDAVGDALRIIDRFRASCDDEGLAVPTKIADLHDGLMAQAAGARAPRAADRPPAPAVPTDLARRRAPLFVGRTAEAETIGKVAIERSSGVIVLRGPAGSGKTALLAEVAERVSTSGGVHVAFAAGSPGGQVGLAAMTAAVPSFADDVAEIDEIGLDPSGRLGSLALRFRERLVQRAGDRSILLMVDDGQWLDSASCELIDFLARTTHDHPPLTIVITARPTVRETVPWSSLQTALDRSHAARSLDLQPLTVDEVRRLVDRSRPGDPLSTRVQSSRWIHDRSGGLPLVAHALLTMIDRRSAPVEGSEAVFDRLIESCTATEREVGVAGAVFGHRFQLGDIEALVERSRAEIFAALDGLVRHELVVETGPLDEFEFSHQLIADAFTRSVTRSHRARLHLKASERASDVHARARHQLGARGLVDVETAVESAIASARAHLDAGAFWESSAQFRTAIRLEPDLVGASGFVDMARSLSLAGAVGASRRIRAKAFDVASASADWSVAHDAAVAGLPEAEIADGESDRLDQLEAIPTRHLDRARQMTQALHASRIASQLGRADAAMYWAESGNALARSDEERGQAAVAEHFVLMLDHPPALRLERLDTAVDGLVLSDRMSCRVEQFRAIDELELGNTPAASRALAAQRAKAAMVNDHLRQWHGLILEGQLAELDGRWDAADELAESAVELGHTYGIGQADIVRLAQQYFRQRLRRRLYELIDVIDLVPAPDADSMLFQSAKATIYVAGGRTGEGVAIATSVAERALRQPSATSLQCLAIVADVLRRSDSATLKERVRQVFEPFVGNGLVIGVGLGFIASVDAEVAGLGADTVTDRAEALEVAIKEADAAPFASWAVRYRLDLAELTGRTKPLREARRLATGTSLAAMLPPT